MDKKLHILFLNSWYPSRVSPNNGDFIQRHAEAVALKHQVTAIHVISDSKLKNSVEIVEFTLNEVRTIIGYIKPIKNPLSKLFLYFTTYLNLYKKADNIDLVHLNVIYPAGIFALYLKWFKNKPFIISEHWSIYHEHLFAKINPFVKFTLKIIAKNSKFIAPVTKNLGNSMNKIGLNGNYHPVPNVVNTNLFVPNKSPHKEFIILHASNMADVKNVPGILNVIKKLELLSLKFTFYFVGENVQKYDKLINNLNINQIKIVNHLPHSEFSKLINCASVLILFSKSENLPCVILESFSCGVPVISTNVGGIKEYFPENFGKLINSDEKQLLDAILEIKNNFNKASDKEMHNYVVQNFSPESICEKFSILYNNSIL
ncbi:MAG: glycosyltransferase [Flavobacteriaceae bacterium]|nr:glycosyltransferase [Flavobacteriaceae bacterium]